MTPRRRHRGRCHVSGTAPSQAQPQAQDGPSPAERFAAARRRQREQSSELAAFGRGLDFPLDDFQVEACRALEAGCGVLVAAPTGAGKTVVGEFAVHLGIVSGRKTFYTTPIKALSNQKYADLTARYGVNRVGLLTGDTSVNPGADVVVMTTEVLRNMLYSGSHQVDRLGYVVMDEVHYLADRFRGPVWEEVIIHLPAQVRLVCLSATVSNTEELGGWLDEVRAESGGCTVVVSEHRPVPLTQHMMVGRRLLPLYSSERLNQDGAGRQPDERTAEPASSCHQAGSWAGTSGSVTPGTTTPAAAQGTDGMPAVLNPDLVHLYRRAQRAASGPAGHGQGGRGMAARSRGRRHAPSAWGAGGWRRGPTPPPRTAVVAALAERGLLPAIVFVFSRAGCEQAVAQLAASGTVLTTQEEAEAIREVIDARTAQVPRADLAAVGFHSWAQALERGFAAHHAGMVPLLKEILEELFSAGLVKVVYATETLALGINMPARTVVVESLRKWNGTGHVQLTPGEYTQLTGRAGRRGIDTVGHAVVLASGEADPDTVASLASRRSYPLVSAFRPTYNMAVNLLSRSTRARAREILESSFAQYQADRCVVELAGQTRRAQARASQLAGQLSCHLGDLRDYMELRQRVAELDSELSRLRRGERREQAAAQISSLRRGDVILVRTGRRRRHAVVLASGSDRTGQPVLTVLGEDGRVRELTGASHPEGVTGLGHLTVAAGVDPSKPRDRDRLTGRLVEAIRSGALGVGHHREDHVSSGRAGAGDQAARRPTRLESLEEEVAAARRRLRAHPCHGCPDIEQHAHAGRRWLKARAQAQRLADRMAVRTGTIGRQFDAVCQVLVALGYLAPVDGRPEGELRVTKAGQVLARVYAERDLLVAECLRQGVWDGLGPADLAAAVSPCVYESRAGSAAGRGASSGGRRRTAGGRSWHDRGALGTVREDVSVLVSISPASRLGAALRAETQVAARIHREETLARTTISAGEDAGLAPAVVAWARGASLASVLEAGDLGAGDLVRSLRMELDLLGQLALLGGAHTEVARSAAEAIGLLGRGVVAWSSV